MDSKAVHVHVHVNVYVYEMKRLFSDKGIFGAKIQNVQRLFFPVKLCIACRQLFFGKIIVAVKQNGYNVVVLRSLGIEIEGIGGVIS